MTADFAFREREQRDALRALDEAPFVALVGPRGAGTTTLLRALLRQRSASLGVATLVSCAGAASAGEVLARTAEALGLPLRPGLPEERLRSLLGGHLDDGPRLLALDDLPPFSPLTDAIADWLAVAPELRVVASCTAPPAGAAVVAVGPLPHDAAAAFLVTAARRRNPGVTLSPPQIDEALRLAGGLPLALDVVAARLASFGPLALRQGSWPALEATLRQIVDALPPHAAHAARCLAAFAGPFSADAAGAVLDGHDEALTTLLLASLVEQDAHDSLWLLPPLRHSLLAPPEAAERHARFFEAIARPRPDQLPELLRAFHTLERSGHRARAAALALRLDALCVLAWPPADHVALLRQAEGLADDPDLRAALARARGRVLAINGQAREGVVALDEALALRPSSASGESLILSTLCYALRAAGDLPRAAAVGQQAIERAEQARDPVPLAMALQAAALVDHERERHDDARRRFELAEAHAHRPSDERLAAICAANLAASHLASGDAARARPPLERAARRFEAAGDLFHRRRIGSLEAALLRLERDLDGAARLIASLRAAAAAVGDDRGELEATIEASLLARDRGDEPLAQALLAQARWLSQRVDDASLLRRLDAPSPRAPLSSPPRRSLRILHHGDTIRRVELDGVPLETGRRGPLLRILLGLARSHDRALSAAQLQAIGWPGERMSADSGTARVYMTVRRLRAFGLGDLLITDAEGYRLHESLAVTLDSARP